MKAFKVLLTVALISVLFGAVSAPAQPGMFYYSGKLTDSEGNPVNDTVSIVFSVYDAESGGTPLWTETHGSVGVKDGSYSVLLGSITPTTDAVFDGSNRWLGIRVGSDSEMTPRQRIASVPYAINSDMVDGQHASAFLSAANDYGRSGVATDLCTRGQPLTLDIFSGSITINSYARIMCLA